MTVILCELPRFAVVAAFLLCTSTSCRARRLSTSRHHAMGLATTQVLATDEFIHSNSTGTLPLASQSETAKLRNFQV